jgi:CubicO group peptidase (beta-lactamase class C family)
LSIIFFVCGCTTGTTPAPSDTPISPPELEGAPFPYGQPEDVGLTSSLLGEFATRIESWVDEERIIGGEFLVVKDRTIVFHSVAGWSDREREIPLALNSIYRIRSMTKPFIGTAILMLVDDGRLGLDDRVAQHISSFDNDLSGDITVRHLLTHTAGFVQGEFPAGYWDQSTLREAVDLVGEHGPPNPPGGTYRYSDHNSATMGAIVAEITAAPVERFVHTRILDAIGLDDTYSHFSPEYDWAPRMNSTYRGSAGSWARYWDNTMAQQTPFFRASGGLYTTVFDYAEFLAFWMDLGWIDGSNLLSDGLMREALNRQPDADYGFHWEVFTDAAAGGGLSVFGHGGSDGTMAIAIPERDIIVLYFTQSRGTDTIRTELLPWVQQSLYP